MCKTFVAVTLPVLDDDLGISLVKKAQRRPSAHAIERASAQRGQWIRLTRTVILGTVATVGALIWLADQYGIERQVMFEFIGTSALFVGLLAAAGTVAGGLFWLAKRLYNKSLRNRSDLGK